MTTRIIVPHRGLAAAKTRLSGVLAPDERVALAERLLRHVLAVAGAGASDVEVVVISPASSLAGLVGASGARLVVQRGMGLNAGLQQARREALDAGIDLLAVLHGDLPNLAAGDIEALIGAVATPRGVAIAADKTGQGTNALALRPPDVIDFRFGAGSLAAHVAQVEAAGLPLSLVDRPGLAFDLDTPADLARWLEMGDAA